VFATDDAVTYQRYCDSNKDLTILRAMFSIRPLICTYIL